MAAGDDEVHDRPGKRQPARLAGEASVDGALDDQAGAQAAQLAEAARVADALEQEGFDLRLDGGAGSYPSFQDIDDIADALESIAQEGPRWTYRRSGTTGEFEPHPDPRPSPTFRFPLAHRKVAR